MEQNVFAALAHGYSASSLSRSLCCYVSQKEHLDEEKRQKGEFLFISLSFALILSVVSLFAFSTRNKNGVAFQAGALAFCSVPVCSVSGVLVSYCCFSCVVFLCLIFGCARCCVDLPLVLFCFSSFSVGFHCCFSLLFVFGVGFYCCFPCVFCLRCVVFPRLCL